MSNTPKAINIINSTDVSLNLEDIKKEIETMLDYLEESYKKEYLTINICFMNKEDITDLNFNHLNKNKPTDTLSFIDTIDPVSGDVAICPFIVKENAILDNLDFARTLAETLLHSLLHLFGMTHTYKEEDLKRIYQLHDDIFQKIKINWSVLNVKFDS